MNLRLIGINASDSRTIRAKFSAELNSGIRAQNVLVQGVHESTPDALVRSVSVVGDILVIDVLPMTPYARYSVTFQNANTAFCSKDGTQFLIQDSRNNVFEILGAENPDNIFRDNLVHDITGQPYVPEVGTPLRTYFDTIGNSFLRTSADIRQAKNDNYLSFYVKNERKRRSFGPYDRLNEEGAISIQRVGLTQENQTLDGLLSYDSFPFDIISLQSVSIQDVRLEAGNGPDTFDAFTITVSNYPVTKLTALNILYQNGDTYEYSIREFGYQLKEPKYDTQFAGTLLSLEDNQIKLSEEVLNDPNFIVPESGDVIALDYEYKSLGRIINEESVEVYQNLDSTREATPALANEFSLQHSPIVDSSGDIPIIGGVQFLDPSSSTPFKTVHPAFLNEIPFRLDALPRIPGQYSIDYQTGRVFVYGELDDDGTGYFPPACTYQYRRVFRRNLDYTYRAETSELVASPIRDLIYETAKISFLYEQVLIENQDYKVQAHQEQLNERIDNRLLSSNSLRVLNSPITNVFRVLNETSGEIYRINRFQNDRVVFSASTPPRIQNATLERSKFSIVNNEHLLVSLESTNILGTRIFKIPLLNKNIMSATEDVIGSSYNTSAQFSRADIFSTELFYEAQILSVQDNTDRLDVGDYQIDYRQGIVYVGVQAGQDFALGTVNYLKPIIELTNPHIMSVSDIYYSINTAHGKTRSISYTDFEDGFVTPDEFQFSDERFLNGDTGIPYTAAAGQITVSMDIKNVRHIFDNQDLTTNAEPVDFGPLSTWDANVITLDYSGVQVSGTFTIGAGLAIDIDTGSSGISLASVLSVIRADSVQLLDGYQSISGNEITFSVASGAQVGDEVNIVYYVVLNSDCTPIIDYNRGEHFIDYTYLADEILVSYEHGDNLLDFRESTTIDVGQEYFVSYRVGALRDALLENFGSSIDIPELNTFNIDLERERYRDALIGALQSFTRGPTVPSMKDMVKEITKINPQIIEAVFQYWALGISPIYQNQFKLEPWDDDTLTRVIVPGIFDNAYLPAQSGDTIHFPVSSNLRLNEGSLEFDVIPNWDGLDNDAVITFNSLSLDGYALDASKIFIGSSSWNPVLENGSFSISRFDDVTGLPSAIYTGTGIFIYYNTEQKRWNTLAKANPSDGYRFTGYITTSGEIYDARNIQDVFDADDVIRSSPNKIDFVFNINATDLSSPDGYQTGADGYVDGYSINDGYFSYSFDGLTFMSDSLHYFFDFAESSTTNRFSLYKDGRGYLNFCVWDAGGGYALNPNRRTKYLVSADIQDWVSGSQHTIGISWKLNTTDRRDEMHLFVDGFEVPNIIRYGGIPAAVSSDRFRTVQPELVAGSVPYNAVTGTAITVQGYNTITSNETDFGFEGIVAGNSIQFLETGFGTYTILTVNGRTLELDSAMPAGLDDARFTVNPYSVVVSSEIDIYKNIAVSILYNSEETEIPGVRADLPGYSISKNALNQNVLTILGNAPAGAQILIRTLGLNHRRCRERAYLWNSQAVLKTQLPPPINLDEVKIRSVILPYTSIGPDNSSIVGPNFEISFTCTQVSNTTEGRTLEVRISGTNVDFSSPTTVTINGVSDSGVVEVLSFSAAGKQNTTKKWMNITSVDVVTTPIINTLQASGIEIKELYSVTVANGNNIYPVIRYGYQTQTGLTLEGDGSDIVSDSSGFFPASDVGNAIVINSPPSVAGTYTIIERIDNTTVRLNANTGAVFSSGNYNILNISIGRSGFQNGFFFLETAGSVNVPYELPQGYYEFDFSTYLEVGFGPVGDLEAYIGSDFNSENQANAVIDEFRILSTMLTDTRVGESIGNNSESITTGAVKISAFRKNAQTLVLLHFNEFPIVNDIDYYTYVDRQYLQSSTSVNDNFGQSICFDSTGISMDSNNKLNTAHEGTIEFWVSPMFDTYNDPVPRVYFDASASVFESNTSDTRGTVSISGRASEILSVRLATDVYNTGIDYFAAGVLEDDFQTISLGTALPYQQTPVIITYIPSGVSGDRMTILKDSEGFISFNVVANSELYQVRQPVFWARDTWHRVKATFSFNSLNNQDSIRLFVDGEERGSIRFGEGLIFGSGLVFGQTSSGVTNQILIANIDFTDIITRLHIGWDYTGSFGAKARMDNFRISNKALSSPSIAGQPTDVNFSENVDCIYPVIENAYTTLLLDFNRIIEKIQDFAILRDETHGIFNFTLNVIDSFGIVQDSQRVQDMLEAMVYALKPATSKVDINYIR